MEVKIMKRESIKPASPTPLHLKTYKLSLLDQLVPSAYVPMVLFYPFINHSTSDDDADVISERLRKLKQSLSETLTHFYPFAGKIKDDLYIDCNDDGVYYVEARVNNASLSTILTQPDSKLINQLLPHDPNCMESSTAGSHVAIIQVNIFECGGIAIGTYTSHKIIDGPTSATFLKAWAAAARGLSEALIYPSLIAPSLFPQNHSLPKYSSIFAWPSLFKVGKCVMRRFVFDASAITTLKSKAASSSFVLHPTRVEAVSAFIWRCAMNASRARYGSQRLSVLSHSVNLRGKKAQPLSEYSIGNLLWAATAQCTAEDNRELHCLVGQLREAIVKINGDFVERMQGDEGFVKVCEGIKELGEAYSTEGADYFAFSSLCKVGIYEADFGWGKPMWVSPGGFGGSVFQNLVFLIETRWGDGIEVWVTLDEQDMAIFESDKELLAFASVDPSPLELGNSVSRVL